ncbi:MAG TPA: pesticidal protein Cry5Ba, partial [Sulfitobacter pontiacus]|nr:pesticidal protein Cry5Ba [Sulfitobacter pontiacus]
LHQTKDMPPAPSDHVWGTYSDK